MALTRIYQYCKKIFKSLYFLMFLNGFLIASMFYFRMQGNYENSLFSSIKYTIDNRIDNNDSSDSIAVKAMNECHYLMNNRASVFNNTNNATGTQFEFFHATSIDLMTTRGACGSYSQVLARILDDYNFPVRIAQMKANGIWAAHNLVEVNTGKHWVILDPTFNVCFVRPDSTLASFADVKNNWPYYARQVPKNYDMAYRYEDVRYANWSKIPILFPSIKAVLNATIGKAKADGISVRTWFLRIYNIYLYIALLIYLPILIYTLRRVIQIKVFPDPATPFTYRNLVKYTGTLISGNKTGILP